MTAIVQRSDDGLAAILRHYPDRHDSVGAQVGAEPTALKLIGPVPFTTKSPSVLAAHSQARSAAMNGRTGPIPTGTRQYSSVSVRARRALALPPACLLACLPAVRPRCTQPSMVAD